MKERILKTSLHGCITTAEQACALIHDGMTVAMSGYAMAGYPKAVVQELVRRKKNGEALTINLITGANVPYLDELLGAEQLISRRTPMCASRTLADQINQGSVSYVEQQMNKMPRLLRSGSFGKIDIAVVEALGLGEKGELIPTTSSGMTYHLMQAAEKIIIEINTAQPESLAELHDIFIPSAPPHARPIPLVRTSQRIGNPYIPIDPDKIVAIIETNIPERSAAQTQGTPETDLIARHLFDFLELELATHFAGTLPPIQLGFGSIANSVASAFRHSGFRDLEFFCGGIGEPIIELLSCGKALAVSTGGLEMTEHVEQVIKQTAGLHDRLVIRNGDMTNNAELIGRLGVLALNTGIEVDIYGNVNSSHINGNRILNGIGGGANFAQNAGLSVILIPSTSKAGKISTIVPMVSHQDICEHDVDILVTEHGVADLRGLDDTERADAIITRCTNGAYQEQLSAYLSQARKAGGGHHPQSQEAAFAWYRQLKENGTMLEDRP